MFGREFARGTWLEFHGRSSDRRSCPGAPPGDVSPPSCPCPGSGMGSDPPGGGHGPLARRSRGVHGAALRPPTRRPAADVHGVRRLGTLLAAVIAAGSGLVVTTQIAEAAITCSSASLIAAITTANKVRWHGHARQRLHHRADRGQQHDRRWHRAPGDHREDHHRGQRRHHRAFDGDRDARISHLRRGIGGQAHPQLGGAEQRARGRRSERRRRHQQPRRRWSSAAARSRAISRPH